MASILVEVVVFDIVINLSSILISTEITFLLKKKGLRKSTVMMLLGTDDASMMFMELCGVIVMMAGIESTDLVRKVYFNLSIS